LVSGNGTSLMELASMAIEISGKGTIEIAPPRSFDVSAFVGDPSLAEKVLGWAPAISLRQGFGQLIELFSRQSDAPGSILSA
jgi:nucleoside-diphosphate-sugar epimerase